MNQRTPPFGRLQQQFIHLPASLSGWHRRHTHPQTGVPSADVAKQLAAEGVKLLEDLVVLENASSTALAPGQTIDITLQRGPTGYGFMCVWFVWFTPAAVWYL